MKFALLGGDDRFVFLYRQLRGDGHEVEAFALEQGLETCAADPETALREADCVVLPLPCQRGEYLNAPFSSARCRPGELLRFASPGALVCAGMPGEELRSACRRFSLALSDYGRREDFALRNAELTAEGALALLLEGPLALRGRRVLILGYGRIGAMLARKLLALGVEVTAAARSAAARAKAAMDGMAVLPLPLPPKDALANAAGRGFDAVVNTIPEPIFGTEALEAFGAARLLELASPPYGFDAAAAEELGKQVRLASGLPGKTAPESAAEVIRTTLYEILEEQRLLSAAREE